MQADKTGQSDVNSIVTCSAAGALAPSIRSKLCRVKNGAAVKVSR